MALARRLIKSAGHAFRGLGAAVQQEFSVRLEVVLIFLLLPCAGAVSDDFWTFSLLAGVLLLVLMAELFNTALEKTLDLLHPKKHVSVRFIKDVAAAGVLVSIAIALLVWIAVLRNSLLFG